MTTRVNAERTFSEAFLAADRLSQGDAEKLKSKIEEFLATPTTDPRLVPLAEELIEILRSAAGASEDLERYRTMRERMGQERPDYFIAPPNLPFTVRSA